MSDLYAKLIFISLTHQITFTLRNLLWITKRREVSPYRATKHLKTIAHSWFKAIVREQKVNDILNTAVNFIKRSCLKSLQKNRIYPLEILEWMTLEIKYNPANPAKYEDYKQSKIKKFS